MAERRLYSFGSFVADAAEGILYREGVRVPLPPKSFKVLIVLIENRGRVVDRDTLFQLLWPERVVEENTLSRHIAVLRKVLNDDPHDRSFIVTASGRGYKFAAPVGVVADARSEPQSSAPLTAPRVVHVDHAVTPRRYTAIFSAVAALATLVWVATYFGAAQEQPQAAERRLWRATSSGGLDSDATWDRTGQSIAFSSDRSGNQDIWVQTLRDDRTVRLTSSPAHDSQPSWSHDGRLITFRSERDGGGLFVVSTAGGEERRVANFGYRPQFSPTRPLILFQGSDITRATLYVADVDGAEIRRVLTDFLSAFLSFRVAWHPDGERVSVFGVHRTIGRSFWTVPLEGGTAVRSALDSDVAQRLETNGVTLSEFAWSPSGDALYFEGRANEAVNIYRVHVNRSTLEWHAGPDRLTVGGGLDTGIAVSPDGDKLAFTVRDEKTRLWSYPFNPAIGRVLGHGEPITSEGAEAVYPDISVNGAQLAYRILRRGKYELRRRSLTNGDDTVLLAGKDVVAPRWSHDGTHIAFRQVRSPQPGRTATENAIVLISADGRQERLLTSPGPQEVTPFDWSADGNWILATCERGAAGKRTVCLLPVSSAPRAQEQMRVIASDPERNLYQATFSPNQKWIAFIATSWRAGISTVYVVSADGGQWTAISEGTYWDDKPRWSPDGKAVYFLSNRSGVVNVWGRRFDPVAGTPSGDAFQVTSLHVPSARILSPLASTELAISADRLIVPIVESAGSVWVLENINR